MAKSSFLTSADNWHKTTFGYFVFMLAEAALAYLFASLAIPSAHTWQWALAAVFGLGTLHNLIMFIYKIAYGVKAKSIGAR